MNDGDVVSFIYSSSQTMLLCKRAKQHNSA